MLSRTNVLFIGALIAVAIVAVVARPYVGTVRDVSQIGTTDFIQYWGGARLLFAGRNPYDSHAMRELQLPLSPSGEVTLLWNPPIALSAALPFALFSFATAAWLWFVASAAIIGGAACLSAQRALATRSDRAMRFAIYGVLLTFYPFVISLAYGQISPLLLLGWVVFLWCYQRTDAQSQFVAGLGLALTVCKPHLLYLVYLFVVLRSISRRDYHAIVGAMVGCAVLLAIPLMLRHDLLARYFEAAQQPPLYWKTPTLGSMLQEWTASIYLWIRYLPALVTSALFAIIFIRNGASKISLRVLYPLAALSLCTSPYGWTYDHMLLLPTILWCIGAFAGRTAMMLAVVFAGTGIWMAVGPQQSLDQLWWYPCLVALVAMWVYRRNGVGNSPVGDDRTGEQICVG